MRKLKNMCRERPGEVVANAETLAEGNLKGRPYLFLGPESGSNKHFHLSREMNTKYVDSRPISCVKYKIYCWWAEGESNFYHFDDLEGAKLFVKNIYPNFVARKVVMTCDSESDDDMGFGLFD